MKYNSKNIIQENNSIFKQLNTNIIFDFRKNQYITELIQNKDINSNFVNNINKNRNLQIYLNGTTEPDENVDFMKTQRNKFSNLANKSNYHTNVNTTKNKQGLNRYNSYKRIAVANTNNDLFKLKGNNNNKIAKNKKNNGGSKNRIISNNNSKGHNMINKTQIHTNNQRMPISNHKKNIIPLGNNKYKTIGDNNYYSNLSNRIQSNMTITNNIFKPNYNERQNHNTIDINSLLSNHANNINKKYNMKKYSTNNNTNINKNKQTKKINYNYNYTNKYQNVDLKRNGSNLRPKTPDNNKRGKSYSRFNNVGNQNQRTKTPDRQRNKMKLNLNKNYLNTIDNTKINKTTQHYNYANNNYYNHTIDNNSNNGKYKYTSSRLNTNDYFKLHKKTINNYDNRQNMTITANTTFVNNHNNSTRKNFYGGNQTRPQKRLSKNSSQGNILNHNNYNINLDSNGINHIHKNINENYNYQYSHSNTNLITPIKYVNQKSNFKADNIQLTQIRPPNNYNLYDETFQSFGTNLTTITNNNQELLTKRKNNINENNNYFEMKMKQENREENSKNNDYEFTKNKNNYNFEKYKDFYKPNRIKEPENEKLQINLNEKNMNSKNGYNTYIPATINNTANKTYSYFNNIQKNNKINEKENSKNNDNINDIDFNDLDQFSPPCTKEQFNLNNNNLDHNFSAGNKYMNLGCIEERNRNYETVTYDNNFGNNRKVIDDFIKQLKTNF